MQTLPAYRQYPYGRPGTALQHVPLQFQVLNMCCCSSLLFPCLTFPSSKLLEEGSKKAELKQEIKLHPQLPAFVQCQKHSRNLFLQEPRPAIFPYFALCCSLPVRWIGLGNHWFPHTVKRNLILQQQESSDLHIVPQEVKLWQALEAALVIITFT